MPVEQLRHVEAPILEYLPSAQSRHTDAPPWLENFPLVHRVQLVLAGFSEYDPALHSRHKKWLVALFVFEKFPGLHAVQYVDPSWSA